MEDVEFKEFRIGDLFERVTAKYKGKGKPKDSLIRKKSEEYNIPVTYAKIGDNGIMYWGKSDEWEYKDNVVGVIYNGAVSSGLVYPHRRAAVLGESYLLKVKEIYGEQSFGIYQYLSTKIEKVTYQKYSREYLATWGGKVEDDVIELPITPEGEPDFEYMENYIEEIEQKYISNLKQKLETDKTNLLKVIGKTEEGIEEVIKTGFNEVPEFKEFKVGDLFNISRGDIKNRKGMGEIKEKEDGSVSFIAQNNNDNGFVSYVNKGEYTLFKGNSIVVGRQTGAVYYQKEDFITTDGVLVLTPKFKMDSKIGLYITSVLDKLMNGYGYNNTVSVSKLKPMNMELPTNREGEPDFQYMERYISYIELTHTHTLLARLNERE